MLSFIPVGLVMVEASVKGEAVPKQALLKNPPATGFGCTMAVDVTVPLQPVDVVAVKTTVYIPGAG